MNGKHQYEEALKYLESPASYPGLAIRPRAQTLLRIWRFPSFQPWSSWALLEELEQVFLRRVTWDKRHPASLTPATYGSEVLVESATYEPLLSRLRAVQVLPFIPVSTFGIDGTLCGIEIGAVFDVSARLIWWETPPAEWSELHSWHLAAVREFDALLPASTPSVVR